MKNETYSLAELSQLVDLPRRTVRYYIQLGLVAPPKGAGRGARYSGEHLNRLLEIRKWQDAGLSLERIGELVASADGDAPVPPLRERRSGSIEVWSRVFIDEGIELMLEPRSAGLTPEQSRALLSGISGLYQQIRSGEEQ